MRHLIKGVCWSIGGVAASRILSLLTSICVARLLGLERFGEYGMLLSTVSLFGAFAGFGLGTTATRYVAELHAIDPERAGRVLSLSSIFSLASGALTTVVMLVSSRWLAVHSLGRSDLTHELRIASALMFFGAAISAQMGILSGFQAFRQLAWLTAVSSVLTAVATIVGGYRSGVNGALVGMVIANIAILAVNQIAIKSEARSAGVPLRVAGCFVEWRVLWKFSLPTTLANLVYTPATWASSAIIATRPNGYSALGVFNAANQWAGTLLLLPSILANVSLPMLAGEAAGDRALSYRRLVFGSVAANFLTSAPIAIILGLLSERIMGSYGAGFIPYWPVMVLLLATNVILCPQFPASQVLITRDYAWLNFSINSFWAIGTVVATAALADHGAMGLAVARLVAYCLSGLLLTVVVARIANQSEVKSGVVTR